MEFAELPVVLIQRFFDLQGKVFLLAVRRMQCQGNTILFPSEDFHPPDGRKFFQIGTGAVSVDPQERHKQSAVRSSGAQFPGRAVENQFSAVDDDDPRADRLHLFQNVG